MKQFRIRGAAWKERFTRGDGAYDDETIQRLDALRDTVTGIIEQARQRVGTYNTAGEKIRGLYDFLESDLEMMEKLKAIASSQEEAGIFGKCRRNVTELGTSYAGYSIRSWTYRAMKRFQTASCSR